MKLVFFSVSENGENGLSDEETEGAMPPRIFGLELPLVTLVIILVYVCIFIIYTDA